jgi:RNA polymerase sigma-32 factor
MAKSKQTKHSSKEVIPTDKPEVIEASVETMDSEDPESIDLSDSTDLVPASFDISKEAKGNSGDPLTQYIKEISRYPLLSIEQEKALTKALLETGENCYGVQNRMAKYNGPYPRGKYWPYEGRIKVQPR